ncbi:MAG: YjjW family glycine radical enzyme activase [Clostridium sp.]|nr:YjjW family glycine radical enzyme activase [Clostridium sp.]
MMTGLVNKIIPFSSVDGPGNRTSIFLQGCNFNCIYCHNPETINICGNCGTCITACPTTALTKVNEEIIWNKSKCCNCDSCIKVCNNNSSPKVSKMSTADIINEINNYKPFIQGITVSGGECTLQEEFLINLFTKVKLLGLTCFIDSNGSKDFREMPKLLEVCDSVMLDVKSFDNNLHNKYINFDNKYVLSNLEFLASIGKLYEVRTVVVPEIFNNEETVKKVSEIISKYDSNIRYKLIKFRNLGVRYSLKSHPSPSDEYMNNLKTIVEENGCKNIIIV